MLNGEMCNVHIMHVRKPLTAAVVAVRRRGINVNRKCVDNRYQ